MAIQAVYVAHTWLFEEKISLNLRHAQSSRQPGRRIRFYESLFLAAESRFLVPGVSQTLGQAATWAIDAMFKVQAEKDKHERLIIGKAKEVVQESASVYHATTDKGHGTIAGVATGVLGDHTQDVLKMEKFAEAENAIMLGPPGLPIGAH